MKEIKDTGKNQKNKDTYSSIVFDDVIVSNFGASTKKKNKNEYECNKTEKSKAKVNKNLSVVEDYSEFSFKTKTAKTVKTAENNSSSIALPKTEIKEKAEKEQDKKVSVSLKKSEVYKTTGKENVKVDAADLKCENKSQSLKSEKKCTTASCKAKTANSVQKAEKTASKQSKTEVLKKNTDDKSDEIVTKVKTAPQATISIKNSEERQVAQTAVACERVLDEAAEQIVRIARIGSLFDCVKNY